jgi:uncharacterized protein (DUF488 family)
MRVYTIGTDHRGEFDFARLLLKFGVQVIFDVRRVPEAREAHFRRDGLQSLTAAQGADYLYMGNELGGPKDDDYRDWITTDEFRRGMSILKGKAPKRVCCILCAERMPENCHRLLIAEELEKEGFEIVHIIDETTVWNPPGAGGRDRGRR